MEERPDAVSTIEKAAARLAAKRGAAANGQSPEAPDTPVQPVSGEARSADVTQRAAPQTFAPNTARPIPKPTIMQGKAQGFLDVRHHHCDIDLTELADRGFLVPGEGRSQLAQEMRRIKRPLLLNMQKGQAIHTGNPPANLIMLTSSLPGEGKTFIAINLAISLAAELDRRVLLVDADVSKGGITEQLGVQAERGLSDLLYETNYIGEDAVLTSNIDRLSILPAGGNTDQIDELFASELMEQITTELAAADPDRVILFDAPPLLATTEAAVLAHHMGQVVLVVEANKTPQDAVSHSVAQLEGCANVSLVLNKTSQSDGGSYGYGYGYGYGGNSRRPAQAKNGGDILPEETAE
jgi:exopolysaccharide/PEP-CTERM locus tyrosine autokinase